MKIAPVDLEAIEASIEEQCACMAGLTVQDALAAATTVFLSALRQASVHFDARSAAADIGDLMTRLSQLPERADFRDLIELHKDRNMDEYQRIRGAELRGKTDGH